MSEQGPPQALFVFVGKRLSSIGNMSLQRPRIFRQRLPNHRASETFTVSCDGLTYTATISRYADGRLGEIFIDMNKAGSAADTTARDSAIILQYGADVETIRRALCRDARGGASGPLGAVLDLIGNREGRA
jgi:hypothetical protein